MTASEAAKTSKPLTASPPKTGQLHRLGFVPQYSSLASSYLAYFYDSAKAYVPEALRPQLTSAEQLYGKHGQPLVSKLTAGGQEILLVADGQIDGLIKKGLSVYSSSAKELQSLVRRDHIGRQFASTRDVVVKRFQAAIDFVQREGVAGSAHYVRVQATTTVQDGLALAKRVLGLAQEKSQQVLGLAQEKSQKAHDTLVKQPLYKKAYESSNNLLGAAQDTTVYKQTVKRLYPVVAPFADPALEKIQPYYKTTVEYWKPVSAAA